MKLSQTRSILLAVAGVLVLCAIGLAVSALVLPNEYPTEQTVERSFVVDVDFTQVRMILVRTDAAKQIITMTGDSEFVDQRWSTVGGGLESAIPLLNGKLSWKLELHGTLEVRTLGSYVGQHVVTFDQVVNIDPDQLDSEIHLVKGSPRLLNYVMTTTFNRDGEGKTRVTQRLTQKILTHAPWFAHAVADRRVYAAADQALVNQEQAIRDVIEKNRDKRWLITLP